MANYRIACTLVIEINNETDDHNKIVEIAKNEILSQLTETNILSHKFKLEYTSEGPFKVVLGEFKLNEVLPFIGKKVKKTYPIGENLYNVHLSSQRYFVFRESDKCVSCGLAGSKMLLEKHYTDKSPHFNLYGEENGKLILMTKDHVKPKATGGKNEHSNYQTMCSICNNLKGSDSITIEGIRELRKIYNQNIDLPRKKLRDLLNEGRKKYCFENRSVASPSNEQMIISVMDIHIWRLSDDSLVGRTVYEASLPDAELIACVRRGSRCNIVGLDDQNCIVGLSNTQTFLCFKKCFSFVDSKNEP